MAGKKKQPKIDKLPAAWLPVWQWQKWHYPKQDLFVQAMKDHWEIIFCAGNGTGKTTLLYWSLAALTYGIHPFQFAKPPLRIKILMHDFEHGYGQIFTEACLTEQEMPDGTTIAPLLQEDQHYGVVQWPSRDKKIIKFANGSEWFFQTSEQKKRSHSGTNFDVFACDEEAVEQIYDESKRGLRTAKNGGKILHAFTPPFDEETKNKGPTWTKHKLIDPWEKGEDDDTMVIRAAMADNPAIGPDFIRKFSKGKSEEQLQIQLYGEYPTWGKIIFPHFDDNIWDAETKKGNLLPKDFDVPWGDPDVKFEMAVDYHPSKAAAIVWTFEYQTGPNKGDVVVFDELSPLSGNRMTVLQTSNAIKDIEGFRTGIKRYGDPKMRDKNNAIVSGFNAWEEFRHCGIRFTEGGWNRDPYIGYSVINDFLRGKSPGNIDHPRLFIKENCKTLRHNMKNHYNVPLGDGTAKPDSKFNDYCVSLKYIMLGKSRKAKKGMAKMGQHSKWPLTSYGMEYGVNRRSAKRAVGGLQYGGRRI